MCKLDEKYSDRHSDCLFLEIDADMQLDDDDED